MISQIDGLHHVTLLASGAKANNAYFTRDLGLRRVKKTVNFDAPDVYHLYYGDAAGTPGTVMTYFPFPRAARGRPGTGEASETAFAVPDGALPFWQDRLGGETGTRFGERRLTVAGPDGETLVLVETGDDPRTPWTDGGVGTDHAIRGFHSVTLRLADAGGTEEVLRFMGYARAGTEGDTTRWTVGDGPANAVDVTVAPDLPPAAQGAGSTHHVAFRVADRARQAEVRQALADAGLGVTPPIDRDYFWAIYFRTPGGVLFEVATNEPGFDRDEDPAHLGEALKLPEQHARLRPQLEAYLEPIE